MLQVTDDESYVVDIHALAQRGAHFIVALIGEGSLAAIVEHLVAPTGGQIFVSFDLDIAQCCRLSKS